MKAECFPHNRRLSGVLNLHYCLSTIFFLFPSPQVSWQKEQGLTVVTIKPTFPKEEEKLTRKYIYTIEKYVVKFHSRDLRHKIEGAPLCDQYFL